MTKFKLAIILITLPFFALGANPPSILVSIKPIHSIIANITNEVTAPELLLDSNISPHTYALKPSDVKKMSDSDIIIYTSSNIENFLGKSIDNLKNDKITIELIKIEGLTFCRFLIYVLFISMCGTFPPFWNIRLLFFFFLFFNLQPTWA